MKSFDIRLRKNIPEKKVLLQPRNEDYIASFSH